MGIGHNGEQKQMPTRLGRLQKGRVGVGTRTLNKLILKRDREVLQRLQCAVTKRIAN